MSTREEIDAIFGDTHRYKPLGLALTFEVDDATITFEQLRSLSKLLGTKNINLRPRSYDVGTDDSPCYGGYVVIECLDVNWPEEP